MAQPARHPLRQLTFLLAHAGVYEHMLIISLFFMLRMHLNIGTATRLAFEDTSY